MTIDNPKESFVARIWLERGNGGDPTWRGHIRHVQGEEEQYFEDLVTVSEFLSRITGTSGVPVTKGAGHAGQEVDKRGSIKKRT